VGAGDINRILYVEDDEDVGPLMEHVLTSRGYAVEVATTVSQALSLLENGGFDLVLTDGRLPDGSGVVVADRAKAQEVDVLIVTGYALSLPGVERHDFLMKPVRPAELLAAVDRHIGNHGPG
jgi:DNA-binding response OmpR family regulator